MSASDFGINVRWFGARSDGKDDGTAVEAALAAGYRLLLLPHGTRWVVTDILPPAWYIGEDSSVLIERQGHRLTASHGAILQNLSVKDSSADGAEVYVSYVQNATGSSRDDDPATIVTPGFPARGAMYSLATGPEGADAPGYSVAMFGGGGGFRVDMVDRSGLGGGATGFDCSDRTGHPGSNCVRLEQAGAPSAGDMILLRANTAGDAPFTGHYLYASGPYGIPVFTVDAAGGIMSGALRAPVGNVPGRKVVCVDTATGKLYASTLDAPEGRG